MAGPSFAERVEQVRRFIERIPPTAVDAVPVGYRDQFLAAANEAHGDLDRMEAPWSTLIGRPLRRSETFDIDMTAALYVVLTESSLCPHLRRGGPQPAWHVLERRRVACRRCMATVIRPVVPVGSCDLCREPAERFTEFAVQLGPVLHIGNAGSCCAWPAVLAET